MSVETDIFFKVGARTFKKFKRVMSVKVMFTVDSYTTNPRFQSFLKLIVPILVWGG